MQLETMAVAIPTALPPEQPRFTALRRARWMIAVVLAAVTTGGAQDPRYAPRTPPPEGAGAVVLPAMETSAGPGQDDAILVPVLRGLVLVADRQRLRPSGRTETGLHVEGIGLLETAEARALVEPFLGQPVTLRRLNELTRVIVLHYRRHHRPVLDVVVPEQNISTGTLQVLVLEGRLGEVRTEGNRFFRASRLIEQVRARPGEVINGAQLLADLAWLNQNPFRQVDLVFDRGGAEGETDVVLRTLDRRPWRFYTGYENSGSEVTDTSRVLAGVNWGNAWGRDHQMNYQIMASPDFHQLVAHAASYVVPLPWRHTLTVSGSLAESRPDLAGGLFALRGRGWQASARYRVPLPATPGGGFTHELAAGVDFKRSNNNLEFGGFEVFDQWTDVAQGSLSYTLSLRDRWGGTAAEVLGVGSPGGLTDDNRTSRFRAARPGATADYRYGRVTLERTTMLPLGARWISRVSLQWADANLLGSEQLGLGGYDTVRGFEEREASSDRGGWWSNEVRLPGFTVAPRLGLGRVQDRLEWLGFVDHGWGSNHRRLDGEPSRQELGSVGAGLRYTLGSMVTVRADHGWQWRSRGLADHKLDQRAHLSIVIGY